jgi:hypothetical protein
MRRLPQLTFAVCVIAISWLAMMGVHELGHVFGAHLTGGTVQRVVLRPWTISRTEVNPNPHPAVVVWLGPIVGCVVPLFVLVCMPRRPPWRPLAQFFAGFCLVANGAYIAAGAIQGIGDAGEMLRTGTPWWGVVAFGLWGVSSGLLLWHRLGSLTSYLARPQLVTSRMAWASCAMLVAVVAVTSLA